MGHRATAAFVTSYVTLLSILAQRSELNSYRRLYRTELSKVTTTVLEYVSAETCAKSCSQRVKCRAFHYDKMNRVCGLLDSTSRSRGVTMHSDILTDLYERKGVHAVRVSPTLLPPAEYVRGCYTGNGSGYRGDKNSTESGLPCQAWGDSEPHDSRYLPSFYPTFDLEGNSCRNPAQEPGEPWCYTMDSNRRRERCGIPRCDEVPCVECRGEHYRGLVDHTDSQRECQRWDLQHPHKHNYSPDRFPKAGLDDNYCRNPNGRMRPWCFTTDPHQPWEYCSIKACPTRPAMEGRPCLEERGEDYRGRVNHTKGGIPCQHWATQHPHRHTYLEHNYPCSGLDRNYCRNPDGREEAPWCFTVDPSVRRQLCSHIPRCAQPTAASLAECYSGSGMAYRGGVATTRHGRQCQAWNATFPHKPWYTPKSHPGAGLEGHSCRNPDGDPWGPWCFTSDPLLPWDYCSVEACDGHDLHIPNTSTLPSRKHNCGLKNPSQSLLVRIAGGRRSHSPWTVSLRNRKKKHFCGGSLVDERWVLSARDCFVSCPGNMSGFEAWLGMAKVKEGTHERMQAVPFSHMFCGPYGSKLVMLKLSKQVLLNGSVATICLPDSHEDLDLHGECEISGFGDTQGTGDEGFLKTAFVSLVDAEKCGQQHNRHIRQREICAGKGDRSGDACEKDYGGPLACVDNNEHFVLQGVMPPAPGCGLTNLPGVHIRVSHYLHWIHKIIRTT
ncbi:hepatocyte growth factor-like protein isoform X2 [Lethenteron reissneri]|uniref:hepatocyte growth factor-like protein isoform X2 n=1 Tax=Lethenteron reissneri TaxID=7753 RepID=UPI002AB6342E|nr:hepatocyte growth factor-like protein isoform X2 [Lethenteron reissneri]